MIVKLFQLKKSPNLVDFLRLKLAFILLFGLNFVSTVALAEELLWFKADLGVNGQNSIPADDNTQLTQWFNQSGTQYHGTPAQHLPGESPDAQAAVLPSMPFYRYHSNAHINFNPVIEFDGSGDGHAIGIDTPAELDQTIFVVFQSAGMGDSQYDIGLLYGGDVSRPSSPGTPIIERSDMSFGIGEGSRLSYGGGHLGDYFTHGDIRLFGLPSVGIINRDVNADHDVDYSFYANGAVDESNQKVTHTGAGYPLTERVRIGRHYSGGGALTGFFAELIVFDQVLNETDRHIIESYLAVKYGITLNPIPDSLGSSIGNNGYDYLNSAGDVIWQSENTDIFKYNIAGLGRDDARQLDQRISRSVNTGSVLTMSTDTDFSSLNLANSRPAFNGDRDYILWATDQSSVHYYTGDTISIKQTSVNNPLGVDSRADRNWQVQLSNNDGSDVDNLSLEFDLNQMVNVDSIEQSSLLVMIDNDGDRDYNTGAITFIDVDQWLNHKAQFDQIVLENDVVFTVGFKVTRVQISTPVDATLINQATYPVSGICMAGEGDIVVSINDASPVSRTVSCGVNTYNNANWIGLWQTEFDVTDVADGVDTIIINATQNSKAAVEKTANKDANTPPRLDLDASNTASNNFSTVFNEGDDAINIADIDLVINDDQNLNLASAIVTLTNSQLDDQLTVGVLPAGISSVIDQNTNGQITITLTGDASLADYQDAIRTIGFSNTSQVPNATPRIIEIRVNDGQINSAIAKATIMVVDIPDLFAKHDELMVNEDSIDNQATVATNDSTTSGGRLGFALVRDVSKGTLQFNTDGSYVYTPHENYAGNDSFSYRVTDSITHESAIITVSITVNDIEDLTAQHDAITIAENSANHLASVAGNDSTTSGATLHYQLAGDLNVEHGRLTFNFDGRYRYTPNRDYFGSDSFSYQVSDPITGEALIKNVTITITKINYAPIAYNDYIRTANSTAVTIAVLANDTDSDLANDPLEKLMIIGAIAQVGTVTWNNEQLTYTPAVGFSGTATVKYHIQDSQGATAQAVVYIDVAKADNPRLPTVIAPDDVSSDANALHTKLDLGTATATDSDGNTLPIKLIEDKTLFEPGVDTVYWKTTDGDGNVSITTQLVIVRPLVSIDLDQTVLEGNQVSVGVHLNGTSPNYPLEIPFTVSGSALIGEDHDLMASSITIESGTEGVINFMILNDQVFDDGETIIIELSDSLNRGNKYTHQVTISEYNVAPDLKLIVSQSEQARFSVVKGKPVVIVSQITHPVANKEFDYQWSSLQDVLVDTDDNPATFSFDTADLPLGIYAVTLKVIDQDDHNYYDQEVVYIEVVEQLKVLTPADSDLDGIPDDVEGHTDQDGDGIADYLDPVAQCNVLPEQAKYLDSYFIESEPGICLRRGSFSLGGETGGAQITSADITADNEDLLINDPEVENVGGIFDFIASGLPVQGQSFQVVIPQIKPIPSHAIYRQLFAATGWLTFVETSEDQVLSALGQPGHCPPPGGDVWQTGLVAGSWCVQLIVADGGINDSDGQVNSTVAVGASGVGVTINNNQQPIAENDHVTTRHNTPVTIDVLLNDTDPDLASTELVITSANVLFGEVTIVDGKLVYTPNTDFIGTDTITYGISDQAGGSDSATVKIVVTANRLPEAHNDLATTPAGNSLLIPVLNNDSDPDNDPLTLLSATAEHGTVTINDDDSITYLPNVDFVGTDLIQYQIEDVFGAKASAIVTVTVTAIPLRVKNSGSISWYCLILLVLVMAGRKTVVIASLLLGLVSVNALANDTTQLPYDCELRESKQQLYCAKPGWYLHGALGLVKGSSTVADFYDPLTARGFDVSDIDINDQRLGLKFNLGYSFTEHLAFELGYTDLGKVDVEMSARVFNLDKFYRAVEILHPTSARGVTFSGVATLPLTQSLTINGRLGLFKWQGDFNTINLGTSEHVGEHDSKGTDLYYGIYGEYLWSKQTRLVLEWERYHFGQNDSDMLSLGVKYFFGDTKDHQATPIKLIKLTPPSSPPVIISAPQELRLIILFANDQSMITTDFKAKLNQIGQQIAGHSIEIFTMAGHTSKLASDRYNQALSERRVNAVANYFINQFSIKPSAIKTKAYGEAMLRDNSGTTAAAHANRRVELTIKYY